VYGQEVVEGGHGPGSHGATALLERRLDSGHFLACQMLQRFTKELIGCSWAYITVTWVDCVFLKRGLKLDAFLPAKYCKGLSKSYSNVRMM
jgi:hypothetical protein